MKSQYLRLTDVIKSYAGTVKAVDRINIGIEKGEFVTFLGPSGSGKTTTLMMIAGFEEPSSGKIELDGNDLTHTKPYERNIGTVFQNYALFPHMTVANNLAFPLKLRRVARSERDEKVRKMLDLVGLKGFDDRYPRTLSGGQQQRVALARSLIFNPDLLLLDEPLGALDKNLREQMQLEIKRIHREIGITMIYVTHDQMEAMTMSDRIVVFKDGRLEQVGKPLDIYMRPETRFVGEFVGDSNFFPGRYDGARPHEIVLFDGTSIPTAGLTGISAGKTSGEVDVMVRPERIRIGQSGSDGPGDNTMKMRIDDVINYGESTLVIGKARDVPVRIRISGQQPNLGSRGDELSFAWRSDGAHALFKQG
ncbi:MAG: ABC transporter ATP-binding protein [Pseudorhodoplanes sp.]